MWQADEKGNSTGFIGGIRYGWLKGGKLPIPDNTYEIPQCDLRVLEDFILCRQHIEVVDGKGQYDFNTGNLYLVSHSDRLSSEYNETRSMLDFLERKNLN